jgi:hypothetical protein
MKAIIGEEKKTSLLFTEYRGSHCQTKFQSLKVDPTFAKNPNATNSGINKKKSLFHRLDTMRERGLHHLSVSNRTLRPLIHLSQLSVHMHNMHRKPKAGTQKTKVHRPTRTTESVV